MHDFIASNFIKTEMREVASSCTFYVMELFYSTAEFGHREITNQTFVAVGLRKTAYMHQQEMVYCKITI